MKTSKLLGASIAIVVLGTVGVATAANSFSHKSKVSAPAKQSAEAIVIPASQPIKAVEVKAEHQVAASKPSEKPTPKVCKTEKAEYPLRSHSKECR